MNIVSGRVSPSPEGRTSLARRQAQWLADLCFDRLPADVIQRTKQCLLDYLGVALKGSTLPHVTPARALVTSVAGTGDVSIIGGGKTTVSYAAYANGTFGHSCEYDDSHFHCGHPGVCVIPAALAVGERANVSGRDLITAIVGGYQTMVCSVGPIHRRTLDLGWHGTKVGGVFGAAGAAAKLLDLSVDQTAHALSLAASEASGPMEYDQSGGEVKRFHAGSASRSGVQAALLAQAGLTGPVEIFEGTRGVHTLFSCGAVANVEVFWTGKFHILETMFKLYPAAGTIHAALDALGSILGRTPCAPEEIASIEAGMMDWAIPHGAAIYQPIDVISAQFSLPFSLGLLVTTGDTPLSAYLDPKFWRDDRILSVANKVRSVAIALPEGASELCARITLRRVDGRIEEEFQPAPRGYPTNPPTPGDLEKKFRSVTTDILCPSAQEELIDLVRNIETMESIQPLCDAIRSPRLS